jgi:hypothetical protein
MIRIRLLDESAQDSIRRDVEQRELQHARTVDVALRHQRFGFVRHEPGAIERDQRGDGLRRVEIVGVEHQEVRAPARVARRDGRLADHGARRAQCVGGPARLGLLGESDVESWPSRRRAIARTELLLPRGDHEHHRAHAARRQLVQHVIEQRPPGHRHQTLGADIRGRALRRVERVERVAGAGIARRAHPRAEPAREDHRGGRARGDRPRSSCHVSIRRAEAAHRALTPARRPVARSPAARAPRRTRPRRRRSPRASPASSCR